MEPLPVSVHAMKQSGLEMGQSAAIFGDGPIGLMLLMLANLAGAGQVFVAGAQDFRLEVARQLGAARAYTNIEADATPGCRSGLRGRRFRNHSKPMS